MRGGWACRTWAAQQVAVDDALGEEQEEETAMFGDGGLEESASSAVAVSAMRKERRKKKDGLVNEVVSAGSPRNQGGDVF